MSLTVKLIYKFNDTEFMVIQDFVISRAPENNKGTVTVTIIFCKL